MNLADDDRARVPFALVGVLLLVTTGAYVTALDAGSDARSEVPAARAAEDARSVARSALVRAARGAARDAAARPLLATANTSAGRAVAAANGSTFRAGLELRIALAARAALAGTEAGAGSVTANVSLRADDARDLVASVVTERRGTDRVAVRFRELSLAVSRDGEQVAERQYTPTVVLHSPVLALHDRVRNFTDSLEGDYVGSGFARGLTARTNAIAWARGYAQYGGAPIANVLANRHVALAANDALLASQRAAFGSVDPASRRELTAATVRTGLRDLVAGAGVATQNGTGTNAAPAVDAATKAVDAAASKVGSDPKPVVAGVNRSADRAYVGLLNGQVARVLDDVYSADARRLVRVTRSARSVTGGSPPSNATADRRSVEIERGDATLPATPDGFRSVGTRERVATVTERWSARGRTSGGRTTRETTYRVGVRVAVRYGHTRHAPTRPFADLNDTVYANVPARAREGLLDAPSSVARTAALAGAGAARENATLAVTRPDGLRERTVENLTAVHRRARNVSVHLPPSAVANGNPASRLAARFGTFRATVSAAPDAYPGAEVKATIALKRAYAARVATRLASRSARSEGITGGVTDVLGGALPNGSASAASLLAASAPAANESELRVRARPAYLSLSAERTEAGKTYPLAARNTNLFSVPYTDATDTLVSKVLGALRGGREYEMAMAARALDAANRTLARRDNGSLAEHRATLRRELAEETAATAETLEARLRAAGVAREPAESAVETGLSRWHTVDGRALALANGSAVRPIASAVTAGDAAPVSRAEVAAELRIALAERRTVTLPEEALQGTVEGTRSVAERALQDAAARGAQRAADAAMKRLPKDVRSSLAAVPAGLPVAPVPGYWYATVNAWDVAVRGGYRRFTVSAPTGNALNGTLTYVREDAPVRLDTDGDGVAERIGANRAPTFDVRTGVVVVVPPGGRGVGDSGNADERSAGWSRS